MSYRNHVREAVLQEKQDAALFESVGLNWLAKIAARKAERLSATLRRSRPTAVTRNRVSA